MSKQEDWMRIEFKLIREEAGLSVEALAALTKSGASTIRNFEEGRTSPSVKTFERWLNELGHELDMLPF